MLIAVFVVANTFAQSAGVSEKQLESYNKHIEFDRHVVKSMSLKFNALCQSTRCGMRFFLSSTCTLSC